MVRDVQDPTMMLDLVDELRPVIIRLGRALRKETEDLGVTPRQAALLWHVQRSPGLSLRELAEAERISPPSLSAHVDRLERAGMLRRERSDDDRRRVGLVLTFEGERVVHEVRTRRTSWLASRLATLEPEQRERIALALPALLALLEEPA
jgi:DNA-binding MarR family transcriptional regulator